LALAINPDATDHNLWSYSVLANIAYRTQEKPDGCNSVRKEQTMKTIFSRFVKDESGATAIEYGLIAAIIAVGIIAALQGLKSNLNSTFNKISSNVGSAN
jgi:pilus assembly protein Flp/PilA